LFDYYGARCGSIVKCPKFRGAVFAPEISVAGLAGRCLAGLAGGVGVSRF
jgi:hypothetical protein